MQNCNSSVAVWFSILIFQVHFFFQWHLACLNQSHIAVVQGGVSSRAIHNWLWICSQKEILKKLNFFYIKEVLCNFLLQKIEYLRKRFLFLPSTTWNNRPQKLLIIGPNLFFSFAYLPIICPILIFCFIKMDPCATSI